MREKQAEIISTNQWVKRIYTGRLYRLAVYFYIPLVLFYPFYFEANPILLVIGGITALLLIYELPDLLGRALPQNSIIARRDGNFILLYLETTHEIELSDTTEISFETGFFPISPLKLEIRNKAGSIRTIKTRIHINKLIRFLNEIADQ